VTDDILKTALAWHDAGATVLPAALDGSKRPALEWKTYQTTRPDRAQVEVWFADHPGLGLLCGQASGNLEMLELEGRAVDQGAVEHLAELVRHAGLADLWETVTTGGYAEHTPSGGLHLLYRVADEPVPGNLKLARDEAGLVLAETRGEGGWVVVAPSGGATHPTGQPWTLLYGGPDTTPTITAAQRHQLHQMVRTLDRTPTREPAPTVPRLAIVRPEGGVSPGDDFEARVDWTDPLLLGGAGWRALWTKAGRTYWRRPGKDTPGISATTGGALDGRDRLYVFSSSTDFEQEVPLTKLHVYAVLHHAGDHTAAARALKAQGFGKASPLAPDPAAVQREMLADLLPDQGGSKNGTVREATNQRVLAAVDGSAARVLAEPAPAPQQYGPTEDGMARALVAHHGTSLRYCPQRGSWLRWDGHRWGWDQAEHHRELILTLARALPDDGDREERTFKKRALSAAGVSGIERLARHNGQIVIGLDRLDADPWILNTPGGIIDLRTGQLRPADPAALCTRSTAVPLEPEADPARWLRFLADTFNDPQLIAYLQRLVGYSAVGMVGPHVLPFAFGSGGNGKGVFLESVTGVLGDYATTAPVGFLMTHQHASHETEIARLAGARMVVCSEVNEGDRFDEAKVKQLTGGDTITARFMRQDHFTFTPTHQLWLMGNTRPEVRTGGRSFWRRLRLIPFEHEVPAADVVDDLQGVLVRDHGPALLAWLVAGAVAFAAGGLAEPEKVKAATAEYEADQDTMARFVDECCLIGGGQHVQIKAAKVRDAYEKWCYAAGETPVSAKAFGMAMKGRFHVELARTNAARMYVGLSLVTDEDASPDASPVAEGEDPWR
jgi:putative DNA primase/helicase